MCHAAAMDDSPPTALSSVPQSPQAMSAYEQEAWEDLQAFWAKREKKRSLPAKVSDKVPAKVSKALDGAKSKTGAVASRGASKVRDVSPTPVRNAVTSFSGWSVEQVIPMAVKTLNMATETLQELTDPDKVLDFHQQKGRTVNDIRDLRNLDLELLDEFTRRMTLKSAGIGALDGAVMGALAMVPVAGSVAAIGADMLVIHALSTAVATRAAYAYGINPMLETEQEHLERMLARAWVVQVPKAGVAKEARDAFIAGAGRVRWSEKFRNDHRIAGATEALMKKVGNTNSVPIGKVVSKMPAIGIVIGAGTNATTLGGLAKESVRYGRTLHLSRRFDLPLPANLRD